MFQAALSNFRRHVYVSLHLISLSLSFCAHKVNTQTKEFPKESPDSLVLQ